MQIKQTRKDKHLSEPLIIKFAILNKIYSVSCGYSFSWMAIVQFILQVVAHFSQKKQNNALHECSFLFIYYFYILFFSGLYRRVPVEIQLSTPRPMAPLTEAPGSHGNTLPISIGCLGSVALLFLFLSLLFLHCYQRQKSNQFYGNFSTFYCIVRI